MLVKLALLLLIVFVIPTYFGAAASRGLKLYQNRNWTGTVFYFVLGTVCLWALFQVIAVPMILLKQMFLPVVYIWCAACLVMLAGMLAKYRTFNLPGRPGRIREAGQWAALLVMLCLIGYQIWQYTVNMHIDDDDSRFVVTALEAYEKNTMLVIHPVTGEYVSTWIGERVKDVTSPWMLYIAMIAKLSGIHPTILAHTVLPGILLLTAYGVYWLIGDLLTKQDFTRTCLFVIFVSLTLQYFGGTTYTQGAFSLVRIWQGKAAFAAIIIPMIMLCYGLMINDNGTRRIWLLPMTVNCAACLMSGMGVYLGGILTAFAVFWYVVSGKRWKRFWYLLCACAPSAVYGLIYLKLT